MANVVEHKVFSKTDLKNNNNKFWKVWFYDDGSIETQNGRQGAMGQRRFITATGRSAYESKLNEKLGKGYIENEVVESTCSTKSTVIQSSQLHDIAKKQIIIKNPVLAELIDFLVRTNAHNIAGYTGGQITYDSSSGTFKTAVGVISPSQIDEARRLLNQMATNVANGNFRDYTLEDNMNRYLSLVPRDFGRYRMTPQQILPTLSDVQRENDLLDGLATSFADVTTAAPVKKGAKKKTDEPKLFSVELDIVDDAKVISWVKNLYQRTRKSMHQTNSYSVEKVYAVTITTVKEAFEKYGVQINNVKKLWHGTKASNLLSILKGGLIIPPSSSSHVTGRMFGNGIYFSDISTKALNYATNFWSGGGRIDRTFMFLADVAMGNSYVSTSYCDYKTPKQGYDSTFAKGGSGSGVHNNEMIVYRTDQVNLVYLVEFSNR